MKNSTYSKSMFYIFIIASALNCFAEPVDLSEPMKDSLVFLNISTIRYDQYQPWKQQPVSKDTGYGCAVGPYEVLTTAENVSNVSLLQAKVYGKNAYVPATIMTVDYELNLCLIELDKDAMEAPLTPLSFKVSYPKGKQITTYWLSSDNHLTTARSTLDRAEMRNSDISFVKNLTYFATNVSRPFGDGEVCCNESDIIGIACWGTDSDSGIIPAESINSFLSHCKEETYDGFAAPGFNTYTLLDPTMRSYLKMPSEIDYGVYVSSVYSIGTGCDELKHADVILSIDGHQLNSYGRYEHPEYKFISFEHILSNTPDGKSMSFEIFRDGKKMNIDVIAKSIGPDDMLIPYYSYGKQPQYIILGGFVFQQLSRDFFLLWGGDFSGKVPPHLYHYYADLSFMPSAQRKDVIVLSHVLPVEANQGYQQMALSVVDSINGQKINSVKDIPKALDQTPESGLIEVTFEMDNPVLAIPRDALPTVNAKISQIYGIPKLAHIEQ